MLIDVARSAVNIANRMRSGVDLTDRASVEMLLRDIVPDVATVISCVAEMVRAGRVIIADELEQVRQELERSSVPPEVIEAVIVIMLFILRRLLKV